LVIVHHLWVPQWRRTLLSEGELQKINRLSLAFIEFISFTDPRSLFRSDLYTCSVAREIFGRRWFLASLLIF
jgi:hypothetical protein